MLQSQMMMMMLSFGSNVRETASQLQQDAPPLFLLAHAVLSPFAVVG